MIIGKQSKHSFASDASNTSKETLAGGMEEKA